MDIHEARTATSDVIDHIQEASRQALSGNARAVQTTNNPDERESILTSSKVFFAQSLETQSKRLMDIVRALRA